jgi:hypothetical protein
MRVLIRYTRGMIVRMVNHPERGVSLAANGEPGDKYPDLAVLIPESEKPLAVNTEFLFFR